MIVAERKPLDEIKEMIKGYKKVLNVGCGGCTSICYTGGQKEVAQLNEDLENAMKPGGVKFRPDGLTIERQCNADFYKELDGIAGGYDAFLSMACGAGVQFLADRYPTKPVFPALNTTFIGVDRDIGWFEETCRACRECVLGETAGICPITRCAKNVLNGPCGGTSSEGKCEVNKDTPCAWYEIFKRLKEQDRLGNILKIQPVREWRNQTCGSMVHEDYRERYSK
ncbi:MAG TPA: methylenetetrahydrofolate reductase C-terminal domain-containing protein [Polyangia bacterium]|nr:methylenetetrahydrofolate reductase C-terminal domain-containing protein [Polyangia bacterium]